MAKFIKSFFQNNEKRRNSKTAEIIEERSDVAPPLDGRRKLSISRSGRMKANKKRQSLSLDLYGENYITHEKFVSKEYHVHGKTFSQNMQETNSTTAAKTKIAREYNEIRKMSAELRTPEEEIDSAFQIIDNS